VEVVGVYEEPEPTLKELVFSIADEYGVSHEVIDNLIESESNWNPNAVNEKTGDYGLVQINLASWPDVTKEQALDPLWSARWAIEKLSEGQEHYWVVCNCYLAVQVLSGYDLPLMADIEPNTYAFEGAVVIFDYDGLKHLAYIHELNNDSITVREANYERCHFGYREVDFNDPRIVGFWSPEETNGEKLVIKN
jgi:hypothetical protein